eukprot:jgi/Bigna1/88251/estExt_fgenesh1_pg.C_290170
MAGSKKDAKKQAFPISQAIRRHKFLIAKTALWLVALYWIGIRDQNLGMMFLLLSGFYIVLSHICSEDDSSSKSEGTYSAYAALNDDGYRLPGTFTAEQYEGELRNRPRKKEKIEVKHNPRENLREHYERKSKNANKPCVCGSGRKYKKCCGKKISSRQEKEDFSKWEDEWT